ncbi:glycosyltransferase family 2 protein [Methylobacterium mesophilicum]
MKHLKLTPDITVLKSVKPKSRTFLPWASGVRLKAKVGIAFSTKDRTHLTRQTFPMVLDEPNSDVYWMDGSSSRDGINIYTEYAARNQNLIEIHHGIVGGPDLAILYSLNYLLNKGYDYVCLIENDVLLERGWLPRLLELFEVGRQRGLHVGAVSARTLNKRVLYQFPDHAVMINLGAGMVMFSRAAAKKVLQYYRTATFGEIRTAFAGITGKDIATLWEIGGPEIEGASSNIAFESFPTSTDWFYDAILLLSGFVSLATIPSMAKNIDVDLESFLGIREVRKEDKPSGFPHESFAGFVRNHQELTARGIEHLIGPIHKVSSGKFVYFPHQILWSGFGFVEGDYSFRWEQVYGPLNIVLAVGSAIIFHVVGGKCDLSFHVRPNGGQCEIRFAERSIHIQLCADQGSIHTVALDIPYGPKSRVEIRALTPGVTWRGVECDSIQPTLMAKINHAPE